MKRHLKLIAIIYTFLSIIVITILFIDPSVFVRGGVYDENSFITAIIWFSIGGAILLFLMFIVALKQSPSLLAWIEKNIKSIAIIYFAIALLVSGYLYIDPPLYFSASVFEDIQEAKEAPLIKGHILKEIRPYKTRNSEGYIFNYQVVTYNMNVFKYSILGFIIVGLVFYGIFLGLKKPKPDSFLTHVNNGKIMHN